MKALHAIYRSAPVAAVYLVVCLSILLVAIADATPVVPRPVELTPTAELVRVSPPISVDLDGTARTVCGQPSCGYVTHYGPGVGYEIYLYDFVRNNPTIENVYWEFSNANFTASCMGTVSGQDCGARGAPYYVNECDEDAVFHVWYSDASSNPVADYQFTSNEIAYAYGC